MSLVKLWSNSRDQLADKHVQQLIAFAGAGKLRDSSPASEEFRAFLSQISSDRLERYANECLAESFPDSGLALQDIVNQIGSRLGFQVKDGRYRGKAGEVGFDGLWRSAEGHQILIEVKTTDTYRIDLEILAGYRRNLLRLGECDEELSSTLIVVGRQDTGDLEAQIRGSRHAWDMRLSSVSALLRLMHTKEEVEDPAIARQICHILIPHEYTRVDGIVDLVFSTAADVREDDEKQLPTSGDRKEPRFVPVKFHEACIDRISQHLGADLLRESKTVFVSPDKKLGVVCAGSKEHQHTGWSNFWYALHPHQKRSLEGFETAYIAFGCGSAEDVLLMPFEDFRKWIKGLNTTESEDRFYWHVHIHREEDQFSLHQKEGNEKIELTGYLLP